MCGIAGIVYLNGAIAGPEDISRMLELIKHRGPDGEGRLLRDNIAIGHRRLAIIDLNTGSQPMSNENGTIWITFNGEIYNYKHLREYLEKKGHIFRTQSDTEVIIHLYEEYNTDAVNHLRGMFAFVIADFNMKNLFLARDHFGIKPLYYRSQPNFFTFASELPALRKVENKPPIGDLRMVDIFLRFSYIPSPYTIYKDIYKMNPGEFILVSFNGDIIEKKKYWDSKFDYPEEQKKQVTIKEIESVLEESVSAHLVSDVPFGVLLSGGVDSSLVAIEMAKNLKDQVKAYTIDFNEEYFSERIYAEKIADQFNLNHTVKLVKEESIEILPDLISHFGEPFGDPSIIPTWYVAGMARKFVPMVLSGDGGDETFAGYGSYLQWENYHST